MAHIRVHKVAGVWCVTQWGMWGMWGMTRFTFTCWEDAIRFAHGNAYGKKEDKN